MNETHNSTLSGNRFETIILPSIERLELGRKKQILKIGIAKESDIQERRTILTPQAVQLLADNGHQVFIESGAGLESKYSDLEYSEAGGFITKNKAEIFTNDIILKVGQPTEEEVELLSARKIVISGINITSCNREFLHKMLDKKATAIAFEYMQDITGKLPVLEAMSEIAGMSSIMVAADLLSNSNNGKGVLLGGITGISPTEVLILGSSTTAEFAIRSAYNLGAQVKVFDESIPRMRKLQQKLGFPIFTSILHPTVLQKNLRSADVVINSLYPVNGIQNVIVTTEMIQKMKRGSVIIDLCTNQGTCIETSHQTTHKEPVFEKFGILHYGIPNICSRFSRTASIAMSNVFLPILLELAEHSSVKQYLSHNEGFRKGVYLYHGILTNEFMGNYFNIPSKNINLLMASF